MAQLDKGAVVARPFPRRLGDLVVYGALRSLWALLRLASLETARGFLEAVAGLVARLDVRHRRVVSDNLHIAFPGIDGVVHDSVVAASFRNWGRLTAEVIHAGELLEAKPEPEWRTLAKAVANARGAGRGLLVLTAHTGNFELLARAFGERVAPLAVFHRALGIPEVDAFLTRERERSRVTTLGRGVAVRETMRILAAGGCVAVPLDQNQRPGHGIFVDVLGRPACTSTVLARLSLVTGAPVLPVFAIWRGEGTVPLVHDPILPPEPRPRAGEREAVLRDLTARYSAEIDRVVRRHPHQWNWAHRRWKTRPAGEAGAPE